MKLNHIAPDATRQDACMCTVCGTRCGARSWNCAKLDRLAAIPDPDPDIADTLHVLRIRQKAVTAWHYAMFEVELFERASRHWSGPPERRVAAYLRFGDGADVFERTRPDAGLRPAVRLAESPSALRPWPDGRVAVGGISAYAPPKRR